MPNQSKLSRRSALTAMAGGAGAAMAMHAEGAVAHEVTEDGPLKGRLRQSACRWCYGRMPLEDLCKKGKAIGLKSIELLDEKDWPTVKEYGLTCAMANGPGQIPVGWNRKENHERLIRRSKDLLPKVAEAGLPSMIVFSGNRKGLSDEEGLENCAKGLKKITGLAEKLGVTVCMELLNSKVNHFDYQCDHTDWGVDLVKAVGSERFKLLYDIYHMQIMEGDVIATLRKNMEHIGHIHTGGVPGRNEIDETQELNYRAICEAIVDTGYTGYLGQEFIPKRDPMTSLAQAVRICDV